MEPIQVIGLIIIGASLLTGTAAKLGMWYERQTQAAEFREFKRQWQEEVSPQIEQPINDWPTAGKATFTFFGVDRVEYDPDADASVFMERQNAEAQAFIRQLREH